MRIVAPRKKLHEKGTDRQYIYRLTSQLYESIGPEGRCFENGVTQNGMSLKMECHSKWNVTGNGKSLKMKCHSKWNVTQN